MDNRENKVQVSHLTKQFGDLLVLNDISFNVKKGEFLWKNHIFKQLNQALPAHER